MNQAWAQQVVGTGSEVVEVQEQPASIAFVQAHDSMISSGARVLVSNAVRLAGTCVSYGWLDSWLVAAPGQVGRTHNEHLIPCLDNCGGGRVHLDLAAVVVHQAKNNAVREVEW